MMNWNIKEGINNDHILPVLQDELTSIVLYSY